MPFQVLGIAFRFLLSIVALGVGIYLISQWRGDSIIQFRSEAPLNRVETGPDGQPLSERDADTGLDAPVAEREPVHRSIKFNPESLLPLLGLGMIVWSLAGGWFSTALFCKSEPDFPDSSLQGTIERIRRPDGTELHVECFGDPSGIPLILTHGWGLDSKEWIYIHSHLGKRCRTIVWDLPGLGKSSGPSNKDWSLEKMAHDLKAVIEFSGHRPVVLVGHSIGGMIILTYCRLFSQGLSTRVSGIVLGQTTYTNPVRTTSMASFYLAIQKPVLEPLCHLMIWGAPLVWLANWWSYLSGSVHRTNHKSFFSGKESREQLGFISRYSVQSWPAVIARGLLGMFRFDATATLATISVPTIVIGGERDTTCKPEASAHMVQAIPAARGVTLKTATHGGVFEFHQQVAETIHELISRSPAEKRDVLHQA